MVLSLSLTLASPGALTTLLLQVLVSLHTLTLSQHSPSQRHLHQTSEVSVLSELSCDCSPSPSSCPDVSRSLLLRGRLRVVTSNVPLSSLIFRGTHVVKKTEASLNQPQFSYLYNRNNSHFSK